MRILPLPTLPGAAHNAGPSILRPVPMNTLHKWRGILAFSVLASTAVSAYPDRPVKIVVPYAAGGSSDVIARTLADQLGGELGQPVIVENRAGAGSMVGTAYVAGERPDGHTLLIADVPFTIVPALYANVVKYDARRAFVPVALLGVAPMYLFTHARSSILSAPELAATASARPGTVSIGSGGNGSLTHLMAELFMIQTATQLTHVPYKGASASVADLAAAQIQASFTTMPTAAALYQAGRLRALAVSSPQRQADTPDVPTFQELGMPGLTVQSWWGLMAPAGTPAETIARLEAATAKALGSAATARRLAATGVGMPASANASALRELLDADFLRWQDVVRRTGVRAE